MGESARAAKSHVPEPDHRRVAPARNAPAASTEPGRFSLVGLQQTVGNQTLSRLIQRQFEDQGNTGDSGTGTIVEEEPEAGTVEVPEENEFGEIDGRIESNVQPHAFFDAGKTSTSKWHHAAGNGGAGNEFTGTVDTAAPMYNTTPAAGATKASASIRPGSGTAKVTRSWRGVPSGDNGTYKHGGGEVWITPKAATRIGTHEKAHVAKSREIHTTHIAPLEARIAAYTGPTNKMEGDDEAAATAALKAHIDWNTAITGFANEDTAENQPMGPVDTNDMTTADFYADYGAKAVAAKTYDHYVDTPPGP
jgi:hypothetical protein